MKFCSLMTRSNNVREMGDRELEANIKDKHDVFLLFKLDVRLFSNSSRSVYR